MRAGEAQIKDEEGEGRTRSLAASLNYGSRACLRRAVERKQLALLHLFQGFVDVDALRAMGDPEGDLCLGRSAWPDARIGHCPCSTARQRWAC